MELNPVVSASIGEDQTNTYLAIVTPEKDIHKLLVLQILLECRCQALQPIWTHGPWKLSTRIFKLIFKKFQNFLHHKKENATDFEVLRTVTVVPFDLCIWWSCIDVTNLLLFEVATPVSKLRFWFMHMFWCLTKKS